MVSHQSIKTESVMVIIVSAAFVWTGQESGDRARKKETAILE